MKSKRKPINLPSVSHMTRTDCQCCSWVQSLLVDRQNSKFQCQIGYLFLLCRNNRYRSKCRTKPATVGVQNEVPRYRGFSPVRDNPLDKCRYLRKTLSDFWRIVQLRREPGEFTKGEFTSSRGFLWANVYSMDHKKCQYMFLLTLFMYWSKNDQRFSFVRDSISILLHALIINFPHSKIVCNCWKYKFVRLDCIEEDLVEYQNYDLKSNCLLWLWCANNNYVKV